MGVGGVQRSQEGRGKGGGTGWRGRGGGQGAGRGGKEEGQGARQSKLLVIPHELGICTYFEQ